MSPACEVEAKGADAVPSSGSDGWVSLNGEIVPIAEAHVSVLDRGFLWGDGVYEVTPCFEGRPFRLEQHVERLSSSVRSVGIPLGVPPDELIARTQEVVELNRAMTSRHQVCRVGHWVTRGLEEWVPVAERQGAATLVILVQPARTPAPDVYLAGVPLTVVRRRRSPASVLDPRVKTTSRMNQILSELEGSAGGTLALMMDVDGHLAEGPTFNVFIVRDGALLTPMPERVLSGITRSVVLELASELGIPASETDISPREVATADECFVTASTWGVLPVASIDGVAPRDAVPGQVTRTLIDGLARLTGFHPLAGGPAEG